MGPLQRLFNIFHKQQREAAKKSSGLTISGKAGGSAEKEWKPSDYNPPEDVRDNRYINQPDEGFPEDDPREPPKDQQFNVYGEDGYGNKPDPDPEPTNDPDPPDTQFNVYGDPPASDPDPDPPGQQFNVHGDPPDTPKLGDVKPPSSFNTWRPEDAPKDPEENGPFNTWRPEDAPPGDPEDNGPFNTWRPEDAPEEVPDDNTTDLPGPQAASMADDSGESESDREPFKNNQKNLDWFATLTDLLTVAGVDFNPYDLAILTGLKVHTIEGEVQYLPSLPDYFDMGYNQQASLTQLAQTIWVAANSAIGSGLYASPPGEAVVAGAEVAAKTNISTGWKIAIAIGGIALGIATAGSSHAGIALFGKALTVYSTAQGLTHVANALGMGSGDLLQAHNNAAFPGTNAWEQLGAGQTGGLAPGAQEALGVMAQGRQQDHERMMQARQLDQDRKIQSNANLTNLISSSAQHSPNVLDAALHAYANNETLGIQDWQMSNLEYQGRLELLEKNFQLAKAQWDVTADLVIAQTAGTEASTEETKASTQLIDRRKDQTVVETKRSRLALKAEDAFQYKMYKEQYNQLIRQGYIQAFHETMADYESRITKERWELAKLSPEQLQKQIDIITKEVEYFGRDRFFRYIGQVGTALGAGALWGNLFTGMWKSKVAGHESRKSLKKTKAGSASDAGEFEIMP